MPQAKVELCTRCGLCVEACPCSAVRLGDNGPVFSCPEACLAAVDERCSCGGVCEEVCPTGAISLSFDIVLAEEEGDTGRSGDQGVTKRHPVEEE